MQPFFWVSSYYISIPFHRWQKNRATRKLAVSRFNKRVANNRVMFLRCRCSLKNVCRNAGERRSRTRVTLGTLGMHILAGWRAACLNSPWNITKAFSSGTRAPCSRVLGERRPDVINISKPAKEIQLKRGKIIDETSPRYSRNIREIKLEFFQGKFNPWT